jgi:hypothetical protein
VFPLDIWRVILHFVVDDFYDKTYKQSKQFYYSPDAYFCRAHLFKCSGNPYLAAWLSGISLIHPRIRRLLRANTVKKGTEFLFGQLYLNSPKSRSLQVQQ